MAHISNSGCTAHPGRSGLAQPPVSKNPNRSVPRLLEVMQFITAHVVVLRTRCAASHSSPHLVSLHPLLLASTTSESILKVQSRESILKVQSRRS